MLAARFRAGPASPAAAWLARPRPGTVPGHGPLGRGQSVRFGHGVRAEGV